MAALAGPRLVQGASSRRMILIALSLGAFMSSAEAAVIVVIISDLSFDQRKVTFTLVTPHSIIATHFFFTKGQLNAPNPPNRAARSP